MCSPVFTLSFPHRGRGQGWVRRGIAGLFFKSLLMFQLQFTYNTVLVSEVQQSD